MFDPERDFIQVFSGDTHLSFLCPFNNDGIGYSVVVTGDLEVDGDIDLDEACFLDVWGDLRVGGSITGGYLCVHGSTDVDGSINVVHIFAPEKSSNSDELQTCLMFMSFGGTDD